MSELADQTSFTRPRLGLVDLGLQLWRAKGLMLLVFLAIFGVGAFFADRLPKEYYAVSRLFVSLSDEYVFRPSVGDTVQNNVPELEELIQTEIELLRSPVVTDIAIRNIGLGVLYPGGNVPSEASAESFQPIAIEAGLKHLFPKMAPDFAQADEAERYELTQEGLNGIRESFSAFATPKRSVMETSFGHPEPALAADVLNAIIDAYIDYRAGVFRDLSLDSLTQQRQGFEADLSDAEDAVREFLIENQMGDFDAERASLQTLYASVEQSLLANEARQSELDGEIRILRLQLGQTDAEVDLFVEDASSQSLVTLELEREELLTRYTPGSQALRDINHRIARARQYLESQEGALGTVRRGPNPIYQQIQTALSTASSQIEATRQQYSELQRQANDIRGKQVRLARLEPVWQELVRNRALVEANVRSFTEREVEARTLAKIANDGNNNIRILERARRPVESSSLKLFAFIGVFLFAAFTALMIGLFRALTRKGFATPGSLERTTGLPVVSTVRAYN